MFTETKEKYGTAMLYWEGMLTPSAVALVKKPSIWRKLVPLAHARYTPNSANFRPSWPTRRCAALAEGRLPIDANLYSGSFRPWKESRAT